MYDCHREREVRRFRHILQSQSILRTGPWYNAIQKPSPSSAAFERPQHPLLKIHADNPAICSHQPSHRKTEETHSAAHIQNRHPLTNIWTEDLLRGLKQPP